MTFDELLTQIIDQLQRQGRVSYGALKRRYDLDDAYLEDLKDEIIHARQLAIDEDNRVLVWVGVAEATTSATPPDNPLQTAPISYTPSYLTEKILASRSAMEGERKQVTVCFVDIKDSTELIRDLDPEAAQRLLDPAIHIMMDAVHRFEGTVNQVLGDGIMALFGAPIAHEDHALRACYAALAMQSAMQPYADQVRRDHGIEMQIRVGLNSGEVVVRTIGNDLHMDYSAVGPTTHLAARMEQLARPGSIRFPASTLRLVEGFVRVHALGAIPVKGMTAPVEAYELTGVSTVRRRLHAAVARGLTRFVGRETEMEALNQACQQAADRHGQVVAAVGEAGVGKSRLLYEFIHSHRSQGWRVLESASLSYGKATPYFPVVDLLKHYMHIEAGDETRTIRAKVTGHLLTLDESLQTAIPALLSLLDVLPEDSPFLQFDPSRRRQLTLDAVKQLLLRESQVQPLLLVFEDLHWIDSETQALLDNLVDSLPTARLLLLVNYRPEYQHSWGSKTYYTQLRLDPLPPASADALLTALLGDDASLVPLKQLLRERTEGNPFFLEESVRTLIETRVLIGSPGAYRLMQDLPTIQVPPTVQTILAARIDRLAPEEKRLLQTASVIGTEVPYPLLQAIADQSEEALQRGLAHLQTAEFLYETHLFPERVYTFKHVLTHDVAYGSLLQERRRMLHAQIVEYLEAAEDNHRDEQIERLAQHALQGELWDKSVIYFRQAATKAMTRSAHREAVHYFEQALVALQHLPACHATSEQMIDLRLALRSALHPSGDHVRITANLREAEALAESLHDHRRQAMVARLMSIYFMGAGDLDRAVASGQRALTLAATIKDVNLLILANQSLGLAYYDRGDYRQAIDVFRQTIVSLEDEQVGPQHGQFLPPTIVSHGYLSWGLADLGRFAEATDCAAAGLRIAERINQPSGLMAAYLSVGRVALRQGDLGRALPMLERALAICQEMGFAFFEPLPAADLGSAYALSGRHSEALPLLEQAVAQSPAVGRIYGHAWRVVQLGAAYRLAGRLDAASETAARALELSRTHRQRGAEAWAMWLLGDVARHGDAPDVAQAATHYQQALALADELGMRPLQAHCHAGLGALYGQTKQTQQAHAALATAIDMYRSMEMPFWLSQAEGALADMRGR